MKTSKRKENLENFYQNTTDKIIAKLESGTVDSNGWSKGWMQHKGCYNPVTKTVYKGMNQFVLKATKYKYSILIKKKIKKPEKKKQFYILTLLMFLMLHK
jgi:antirestriction protein ArdC